MFGHDPEFVDRHEAGRQLAAALQRYRAEHPLVLALPRGGVPVAYEVANALGADLDLLLVRKIGAPGQPELGLGAVVDGANPQVVLNEQAMRLTGASRQYLEVEVERQLQELERRRRAYFGNASPRPTTRRTVIVVDDGIATGGTIRSALRAIRRTKPAKLILAVPVAPRDTLSALATEADEIVVLTTPEPFYAVGAHYADFTQTTDEEVKGLLQQSRTLATT